MKLELKAFYPLFKIPDTVSPETAMRDIGTVVPGYDFHEIKTALE